MKKSIFCIVVMAMVLLNACAPTPVSTELTNKPYVFTRDIAVIRGEHPGLTGSDSNYLSPAGENPCKPYGCPSDQSFTPPTAAEYYRDPTAWQHRTSIVEPGVAGPVASLLFASEHYSVLGMLPAGTRFHFTDISFNNSYDSGGGFYPPTVMIDSGNFRGQSFRLSMSTAYAANQSGRHQFTMPAWVKPL